MKKLIIVLAVAVMAMVAMSACSEHLCPAYSHNVSLELPDLSD
jgi:hypothetical protein